MTWNARYLRATLAGALGVTVLVAIGVVLAAWQLRARFPDPDYDSEGRRAERAWWNREDAQ